MNDTRRGFLKTAGLATIAALCGCTDSFQNEDVTETTGNQVQLQSQPIQYTTEDAIAKTIAANNTPKSIELPEHDPFPIHGVEMRVGDRLFAFGNSQNPNGLHITDSRTNNTLRFENVHVSDSTPQSGRYHASDGLVHDFNGQKVRTYRFDTTNREQPVGMGKSNIAITHDYGGDIRTVNFDTSQQTIVSHKHGTFNPTVDGNLLAYTALSGQGAGIHQLFMVDLDTNVSTAGPVVGYVKPKTDGKNVFYQANQIHVIDGTSGQEIDTIDLPEHTLEDVDEGYLLLRDKDKQEFVVYDMNTREMRSTGIQTNSIYTPVIGGGRIAYSADGTRANVQELSDFFDRFEVN